MPEAALASVKVLRRCFHLRMIGLWFAADQVDTVSDGSPSISEV
jgi:hypothetical protein